MLYNKTNLLLHDICADDNTRQELNGVLFKKDKTITTDGYILIEVDNSKRDIKFDDYPDINEKIIGQNFPNKGFIIPAKSVKKALSNLNECKNTSLPILENVVLAQTSKENQVKICSTNLERTDIVNTLLIENDFPNYAQIIPQNLDKAQKISVDINKLKKISTLLSQMNTKNNGQVDIYMQGNDKALVIKAVNNHNQHITALIMPIKS